jgi:hypothetical protein
MEQSIQVEWDLKTYSMITGCEGMLRGSDRMIRFRHCRTGSVWPCHNGPFTTGNARAGH